jgi:hypothetical protein
MPRKVEYAYDGRTLLASDYDKKGLRRGKAKDVTHSVYGAIIEMMKHTGAKEITLAIEGDEPRSITITASQIKRAVDGKGKPEYKSPRSLG